MPGIGGIIENIGSSVGKWVAGSVPNALGNIADDAFKASSGLFRAVTMPARQGKVAGNFWTGVAPKPWFSTAIIAGGVGIGTARGFWSQEQITSTGTVYPAVPPPNLSYDYVPNLEAVARTTPRSAESLGAGGDLVFALQDAYMR